jgi:hypothetical protein
VAAGRPPDRAGPPEARVPADRLARSLGSLVHDFRGPVTALTAFAHLLDERYAGAIDGTGRSYVDAFGVNAETLAHLVDGLAFLAAETREQPAPLGQAVRDATARLQKVLARGRIPLNLPAVFPDRNIGRRSLALVLEAVLLRVVKVAGRCRGATLALSAAEEPAGTTVILTLRCNQPEPNTSPPHEALRDEIRAALSGEDFGGMVLRTALEELGGELTVAEGPGPGAAVALLLRPRQPNPAASRTKPTSAGEGKGP